MRVALANGADGVFLSPAYSVQAKDGTVNMSLLRVRAEFGADIFVGVNYFVGDTASFIDRVPHSADAVWHDYGVGRVVRHCTLRPAPPARHHDLVAVQFRAP